MDYFRNYFPELKETNGEVEVKVHCPFHSDTNPSASVNINKSLFFCHVCGKGHNEQQFIAEVNGISMLEASKVLQKSNENIAQSSQWLLDEMPELWTQDLFRSRVAQKLKLSDATMQDLKLGLIRKGRQEFLGIPVLFSNVVMDVRQYNIFGYESVPKIMSQKDAQNGWVIPFDLWKDDKNITYIFEGEKDMMLARELGLNAITLTGGANARPNEFVLPAFKDKDIIICYDNDNAGRLGANQLYLELKNIARTVRYINIGEVVEDEKEDFFDMIVKYDKTIKDFLALPVLMFDVKEEKDEVVYDTLKEALQHNKIKVPLRSKVIVSGEFADVYAVPETVKFVKGKETNSKTETMVEGETKTWYLDSKNLMQVLELIEASANEKEVSQKLKKFANIPSGEPNLTTHLTNYKSVFKTRVSDSGVEGSSTTVDLYSFQPMTVGKKYEIHYNIYPHPTKDQKLIAFSGQLKSLDDLDNYKVNSKLLEPFTYDGSIEDHVLHLYESAKHHIAKHLNFDIWLMNDLVFNSILEIDYNELIRGSLDVFILGDTQVGKSETAQKLVDLYSFGHFLSLKTSTTVGLIGGSNKVEGSWLNTVGAIPRQHKGLAVLEEFSGAKSDFIKTMTDIRSSGKLRLARASGEMEVDCRLRMITISNPLNDENGNPRHLSTFPNGVTPITELVQSAEDVARYDAFLLVQKPETRFNPFKFKLKGEPIPKESYEQKALWVATRKPEHVIFEGDTDSYIWEKSEQLNELFESNFPLFTTTTSQKLARFSVALSSLLMSTDDTYQNVIVTPQIVDYVYNWLISIYDNNIFKLREYKKEYDLYNNINEAEIKELERLYVKNSVLLEYLASQSFTNQQNMRAISGLEMNDFSVVLNSLVQLKMLKISKNTVLPSRKFMIGMNKITKDMTINTGVIKSDSADDEIF
jgi:DNA primase